MATLLNDDDYELVGQHGCWVTVKNLAIRLKRNEEGVSITVYRNGHETELPLAETWVLFSEADSDDNDQRV